MPASWAPLFGSLFCLVIVCCCVLTSLVPHHLQEDLESERERFWGYTSEVLNSAEQQLEASLRTDPFRFDYGTMGELPCHDEDLSCPKQAQSGLCETDKHVPAQCRKSCRLCGNSDRDWRKPNVRLSSGHAMPRIGFGTAGLGESTKEAVIWALQSGYRLLDSAQAREWYREDLVGSAVIASGIPREELFLTSKLHPRDLGQVTRKLENSLKAFNTTYLDLFLLHYPRCWESLCGEEADIPSWQSAWKDLEGLVKLGKLHSIGVSNFAEEEVQELIAIAEISPSVVQSRSDIFLSSSSLRLLCAKNNIQFQGYSTLGTQWMMQGLKRNPVLTATAVLDIAAAYNTSAAHVALKWALQNGQAVLPRSSSKSRIVENFGVLGGFQLTAQQMQTLDALDNTLQ